MFFKEIYFSRKKYWKICNKYNNWNFRIFDPAAKIGLNNYEKEDYGQTLGTWGVGEGCYIVLPILGPSTVRDTTGRLANYMGGDAWYNITVRNDTQYVSDFDYYFQVGATGIDFRAKNLGALII